MENKDIQAYIQALLQKKGIKISENRENLLADFIREERNVEAVKQIFENQQNIMNYWTKKNRIQDILDQHISLPNAMAKKEYSAIFDFQKLNWQDVKDLEVANLEETGLTYYKEERKLAGIPLQKGDLKLHLKFQLEEGGEYHTKILTLIVNPDPKSLWKDLASNPEEPYWKEDRVETFAPLGHKHIVAASVRGRSHADKGGFREDDFRFKYFEKTEWSLVVVSDGAGSAKFAREGSKRACETIIEYFDLYFDEKISLELDEILEKYHTNQRDKDSTSALSKFIIHHLPKAVQDVHHQLDIFSKESGFPLKELNATLIFALFKKYEFGYAIMTFGVGDCPIAWMNKEQNAIKLMNKLDVGEFGGGTRFITMKEIFESNSFYGRFGFTLVEDFSYLFLMTDGIYDPKFVVEANLEKIDKWQEFLEDLKGNNEEKIKVDFDAQNIDIAQQLSQWMDFWSSGNHDDRTLAIIF